MSRLQKIIINFVAISVVFFSTGCEKHISDNDSNLKVAVSILPYKGIVRAIGGDKVEVASLLPPGVSPPEFDPTPKLLKKAAEADLYIRVGEFFEFENVWLDKLTEVNRNVKIFESSDDLQIEHHNPHVWHGIDEVKQISRNICDILRENDSVNADMYRKNLSTYTYKIDSLAGVIKERLKGIENRIMFTYHPAWLYFGKSFDIELVSIEDHGKEPKAQDIARLIDRAKR